MTVRCTVGRNTLSNRTNDLAPKCPEPVVPGRSFCATHLAQAMNRVALVPVERRGPRLRWQAGWMVSGSSRD